MSDTPPTPLSNVLNCGICFTAFPYGLMIKEDVCYHCYAGWNSKMNEEKTRQKAHKKILAQRTAEGKLNLTPALKAKSFFYGDEKRPKFTTKKR
jgi:hypothetical protein